MNDTAIKLHYLKTYPEYFRYIDNGDKMFELRKNDRNFKIGDALYLQEYLPEEKKYTGRFKIVIVTYILPGGQFGIEESYCILSIRKITDKEIDKINNLLRTHFLIYVILL